MHDTDTLWESEPAARRGALAFVAALVGLALATGAPAQDSSLASDDEVRELVQGCAESSVGTLREIAKEFPDEEPYTVMFAISEMQRIAANPAGWLETRPARSAQRSVTELCESADKVVEYLEDLRLEHRWEELR